jgi:hypothetical protein
MVKRPVILRWINYSCCGEPLCQKACTVPLYQSCWDSPRGGMNSRAGSACSRSYYYKRSVRINYALFKQTLCENDSAKYLVANADRSGTAD